MIIRDFLMFIGNMNHCFILLKNKNNRLNIKKVHFKRGTIHSKNKLFLNIHENCFNT